MARKNRKRARTAQASPRNVQVATEPQPTADREYCKVDIDIDPRYDSSESLEAVATIDDSPSTAAMADDTGAIVLQHLREEFASFRQFITTEALEKRADHSAHTELKAERDRLGEQVSQLQSQRLELQDLVTQLQQQNSDLASEIASSCVKETVASRYSSSADALSWDQRKELILQQMEDDSFDAESFIATLNPDTPNQSESPAADVQKLRAALENCQSEIARRDQEIAELRCLLDQQSETIEGGVAIGAAAIAEVVDADELIQEERQRLMAMQKEWEEKFRGEEIKASLERAKLARERQQLAQQQADLEEKLADLQKESLDRQQTGSGGSRRWLDKLGLSEG